MANNPKRSFILGDRWLYYKIYTGTKTSDEILKKVINPVTKKLIKDEVIDRWFYIRYSDPHSHIRVRFHQVEPKHSEIIINCMYSYLTEFAKQNLVWKVQTDTYHREIERYGEKNIDLSEDIFYHDSEMVIKFIERIEGLYGEELRWLFSLRAIDSFLNCFKYTDEEKKNLLIKLSVGFRKEFDISKILGKQLNDKYRANYEKIYDFMLYKGNDNFQNKYSLDLIMDKEKIISHLAPIIIKNCTKEHSEISKDELMSSYIHMLMNRIFRSQNRTHEMVCYDFLCRYYKSMIARKKYST